MKNTIKDSLKARPQYPSDFLSFKPINGADSIQKNARALPKKNIGVSRTGILLITSYPPRECGIATYSHDLISNINKKFSKSFSIKVCALESVRQNYIYPSEVITTLNTRDNNDYTNLSHLINENQSIQIVVIQHEFGFFHHQKAAFTNLLNTITKPVVIVFHTVLPTPDNTLKSEVNSIAANVSSIVVMTRHSSDILVKEYGIPEHLITVIPHGTHLVAHVAEKTLKKKHGLTDRKVLSTFGLLSSGKSIETTLEALPSIVRECPEVVFLIMGMTHPEVIKNDGEIYREMLEKKVKDNKIEEHVIFINRYLPLPELLEYLQLTDIYLFTTNDPNQAVSGTFAYAASCACPIISTPIPHALEVLTKETGIIIDFYNSKQLASSVIKLLKHDNLRKSISFNTLTRIMETAWENVAIAYVHMIGRLINPSIDLKYSIPEISLDHLNKMTTRTGIIQFSKIYQPLTESGYTLDDNARALIAFCSLYEFNHQEQLLASISKYLDFIQFCVQSDGKFLNYVDKDLKFTAQNHTTNLDDSNGRAIWALGYVVSLTGTLPEKITSLASKLFKETINASGTIQSTRAMAFIIKGTYYFNQGVKTPENIAQIELLSDRLVQMYRHEASPEWEWFEGYLTYANSLLPEALLFAWLVTGKQNYKDIAVTSLDFLMSKIFKPNGMELISNKTWFHRDETPEGYGEQPIDAAYTVMTLYTFYKALSIENYHDKMIVAFNWFLGANRLHQIMYNPCTGGCYDGLEESNINLNQGAESTVSYLLARLAMEADIRQTAKVTGKLHFPFSTTKSQAILT